MNKKLIYLLSITAVLFIFGISSYAESMPKAENPSPTTSAASTENQNVLRISVGPTSGVRGVVVNTVAPGSPCESVLKPGDTIFAVETYDNNGQRLDGHKVNFSNYQEEVSNLKIQPGMTVKLLLNLRPVREVSCTIPAGSKLPAPPASSAASPKQ